MELITSKTPGVTPIGKADFTGKTVVINIADWAVRLHNPLLQFVVATGGSGCRADTIGTGVFVRPLYEVENMSYDLRPGTDDDSWKAGRWDVIGIASDELVARYVDDAAIPRAVLPADPLDFCILGVKDGNWVKRDTVAETLKALKVRNVAALGFLGVVHREASINDFGGISTPWFARRPNDADNITVLYERQASSVATLQEKADRVIGSIKFKA